MTAKNERPFKHTPGPWRSRNAHYQPENGKFRAFVYGPKGEFIASAYGLTEKESKANAWLVEKAPELWDLIDEVAEAWILMGGSFGDDLAMQQAVEKCNRLLDEMPRART